MTNAYTSRRAIEEGFNDGNLATIDEITAEGFRNHDPADGGEYAGRDGFKRQIQMYRTAFPDLHITIEDIFQSGDEVALRWTARGTHRGDLMGLAPTGVQMTTTGISIDRHEDGKIVETWTIWDTLGLMRQLGAAPEAGSLTEKVGIQLQHLAARRQRAKTGVS
jgi:steroid delta-isomerase-like uncharacterized protein